MDSAAAASNPPAPVQVNVTSGPVAGTIEAGAEALKKIGSLTPQSAMTAAMLALVLFVCGLLGYLVYSSKGTSNEMLTLVLRAMETEGDKNRAALSVEFERNRSALSDSARMAASSQQKLSVELGRLEQTVTGLANTIAELRRKIPPEEATIPECKIPRSEE